MKKTILIVDDDRSVADSLRKLLAAERFNVLIATDGAEATRLFRDQPVDLVVLDINLGYESGWEVFQTMQEIKPYVPTIIITAEYGQRDQAIAAGAEALVEKPIDVPPFLDLIRELLADSPHSALGRTPHKPGYCRFHGRDHATFLRLLQERRSAPLESSMALPGWHSAAGRKIHNPQTVVGDPTTNGRC
jgi:DNA-binding response OmpR family regulator